MGDLADFINDPTPSSDVTPMIAQAGKYEPSAVPALQGGTKEETGTAGADAPQQAPAPTATAGGGPAAQPEVIKPTPFQLPAMPTLPLVQPSKLPAPPEVAAAPAVNDQVKKGPVMQAKMDAYWGANKPEPSAADLALLGAGSGLTSIGSQGRSLMDVLSGHIQRSAQDDWQNQYDQGIPQEWRDDPSYKSADTAAQAAGYAAAPAAAGAALEAAGIGAATTGAVALGGAALEGGAFGAAGNAQKQLKTGKPIDPAELGIETGIGAALGMTGAGVMMGAGKLLTPVVRRAVEAARSKMTLAKKLSDLTEQEIMKQSGEQIAAANKLLAAGSAPATPIAVKQVEQLAQGQLEDALLDLAMNPDDAAATRLIRKHLPGNNNKQLQAIAKKFMEGGDAPTANPKFYREEPAGQARKLKGGIGYNRVYDSPHIDQIADKLPPKLAARLRAALAEIGETKAAAIHLEKQREVYAQNAVELAQTPVEKERIIADTKPRLTHEANDEKIANKDKLFQEQQQHARTLEHEMEAAKTAWEGAPEGSSVRQQLHSAYIRAQKALDPFEAALKVSREKHLAVHADATKFETKMNPPAKTFVGAAHQVEEADAYLKNAERHLDELRKKYKDLFHEVDDALGERTSIRSTITHSKYGDSETEMSVGTQFNASLSTLVDRWDRMQKIFEAGIAAVETNWKTTTTYKVARALRTTAPGAEKLLHDAGIIHPDAKGILLAGAIGAQAFLTPPAEAADGTRTSKQKQREMAWQYGLYAIGAFIAVKHGPAGARAIFRSRQVIADVLYSDTQELLQQADGIMSGYLKRELSDAESISAAVHQLRTKLTQMHFVCDDAHAVMQHVLNGDPLPKGLKVTPEGLTFAREVSEMQHETRRFISAYREQFDKAHGALSDIDKRAQHEVLAAVHFTQMVYGAGVTKFTPGTVDMLIPGAAARAAKYNFTQNWKIFATAVLHDHLVLTGLQNGPGAVWQAYHQITTDPLLRQALSKFYQPGVRSELQEEAGVAHVFSAEIVHNMLALQASLNKQFSEMPKEMRFKLGVTSARELTIKFCHLQLPDAEFSLVADKVATDIMRTTGTDPLRINRMAVQRAVIGGAVMRYGTWTAIEQRLYKENAGIICSSIGKRDYATAIKRFGWIAAAMAAKHAYGGAKSVIPLSVFVAAMSNPATATMCANASEFLNKYSIGVHLFGDMGEHGRWDPFFSPFLVGQEMPGVEEGLKTAAHVLEGFADIKDMVAVLGSAHPEALLVGSKNNEIVRKGQAALINLINTAGFWVPTLGKVSSRFLRDFVKYLPDVVNNEHMVGTGTLAPWVKTGAVESPQVAKYQPRRDETGAKIQTREQAAAESRMDALLQALTGRRPGERQLNRQAAVYAEKAQGGVTKETQGIIRRAGLPLR